ncbi:arginine:ornithine antiporter [Halolamina sp. CBA1230]|uniref:arginine/ornithine antiporter ArcD n=1 Tax=Halolamina sp. CBA1230 TaxID=1853690 RepID=UPI0009A1B341|nr:Na+/H+ antiporter NhaC family protein [Halolamina sp. CBA1230]QKY19416.1 arginine:ornithine antiporter [Halolamina sp. CBA1230]
MSSGNGSTADSSLNVSPTLEQALVPTLAVVVFLGLGSGLLGMAPHAPLLWSVVFAAIVGRYWIGVGYDDLADGVEHGLRMGLQAILILFTIYALIATWIAAGTIPGLMYYGLGLLTPETFLPATALLAAVVAFSIGSSWTTAGTLGVAFTGIGSGLGIPIPMTAGAVLSGAYAGDKQSPLSDTTNLAAAVTDTELYDHILSMRLGTAIAFGLSVVLYGALGLQAGGAIPAGRVGEIRGALAGTYDLGLLVFVPLLVTFALAVRGVPALASLVAGVFAGAGTTVLVQGTAFTDAWDVFLNGTAPETGVTLVNDLLVSGGLSGSAWTISVVVLALSLGGLLDHLGILSTLATRLASLVWGQRSLVIGTGASAFVVNAFSAQQYMSIVVPGMTLRELFDEHELDTSVLSRAVESAGTPTGALLPWHAGGVFMVSVFGLEGGTSLFILTEYAEYYYFAFLSPLVLVVLTLAGVGLDATPPRGGVDAEGEAAVADD